MPKLLVLDPQLVEQCEHLDIKFGLGLSNARVIALVVFRAAVVHVLTLAALRLLGLRLASNRAPAVTALDQFTGVGQFVRAVDFLAKEELHPIPRRPVHERLVRAGVPLTSVLDLADVGAVSQNAVELAATDLWLRRAVDDAFLEKCGCERFERVVVVGVKLEDAANLGGVLWVNLDKSSPVDTDVAIAEGWPAGEQAALDPTRQPFLHVERLLLGVEARHARQNTSLHSASRGVLGRLGNRNELYAGLGLQAFKLHVIEQVASGSINFVEKQAVKPMGVRLGVAKEFFEGLAFIVLAGSLGDAEEANDFTTNPLSVATQSIFLNVEGKSLPLLLSTAHTSQCYKSFRRCRHVAIPWPNKKPLFNKGYFCRVLWHFNRRKLRCQK